MSENKFMNLDSLDADNLMDNEIENLVIQPKKRTKKVEPKVEQKTDGVFSILENDFIYDVTEQVEIFAIISLDPLKFNVPIQEFRQKLGLESYSKFLAFIEKCKSEKIRLASL